MDHFSSQLLERAVNALSDLPGVGRKTALRLALHILRQDRESVQTFASAILDFRNQVKYCKVCHNLSDTDVCEICSQPRRNRRLICVVENVQNVLAIENTQQYDGLYHVLGGIISPMDGIGPDQLTIKELLGRINRGGVSEVIMATNPTVEGEATAMYIAKLLKPLGVKVSRLAYGIPVGGNLEYADEVTLWRAMEGRSEL